MSENNVTGITGADVASTTGIVGATVGIGQYIINDYVITIAEAEGDYGYTMTITRGTDTQTATLYGLTPEQYNAMLGYLEAAQSAAENAAAYMEAAINAANTANTQAGRATQASNTAQSYASQAQTAKQGAEAAKTDAQTARTQAQGYRQAAEAAATRAETAAEEITGMTAEAETLEPGSPATASFLDGVLSLGIPAGAPGADGDDGNGIVSIVKTGTSGNVDTYTITYTNGSSSTFTVTNGTDGAVTSVAGKTGAVTLDAGDVSFDDQQAYNDGTVGAGLTNLKSEMAECQEELGITPSVPTDPVEIDLSNPETGYYYVASSPENTASWNSTDYGLRGVFLDVQEGEKYVINCSLNANNAVYVLFGPNDTIKRPNNYVYPAVYPPYTSATGNIDFTNVEVTIPANVDKIWIGFKAAKSHSAIKYPASAPTTEKLSSRVSALEAEVAAIDISDIEADDEFFKDELGLLPAGAVQEIDLSDAEVGYFAEPTTSGAPISYNTTSAGVSTIWLDVEQGDVLSIKATLSTYNPLYVMLGKYNIPRRNSEDIYPVVYPAYVSEQSSTNVPYNETVTIPAGVHMIAVSFKNAFEHSVTLTRANAQTKLTEKVAALETPVDYSLFLNKIACIGDSLTVGAYKVDNGYINAKENYPFYFKRMIDAETVDVYATTGYSAKDWYTYYHSQIDYADYDTLLVWLGTNVGLTDTIDTDVPGGGVYGDTNTGNYCHIIEDAITANENVRIFLASVFTVSGAMDSQKVATTNAVIDKIAAKYSENIVGVVNMRDGSVYGGANNALLHPFTGDSIHFGKVGNLYVATHWRDEINRLVTANQSMMEVLYNNLYS